MTIESELLIDNDTCTCSDRFNCAFDEYPQRYALYADEGWHNMTLKSRAENLIKFMFDTMHDNTIILRENWYYAYWRTIYCLYCGEDQLISHDNIDPLVILEKMVEL